VFGLSFATVLTLVVILSLLALGARVGTRRRAVPAGIARHPAPGE